LAQAGVGLLLDYRWTDVRFPDGAQVLARWRAQERPADVLLLGSSRLGLCVRAAEVQRQLREISGRSDLTVYNAAVPGGDLITADYLLERLLADGRRPGLVLIEVSPETLASRNAWLENHLEKQFTAAEVLASYHDLRKFHWTRWTTVAEARLVPLLHFRRALRDKIAGKSRPAEAGPSGYDWESVFPQIGDPQGFPAKTAVMLPQIRNWVGRYRIAGAPAAALDRLVDRCQERRVPVVLFGVPVSGPYRQYYAPPVLHAYHEHLEWLRQERGVRWVDFQDQVPDGLFWDAYHVLDGGADLVSGRLAREVLGPALAGERVVIGDPQGRKDEPPGLSRR
jgi:hypothetical protein